MDSYRSRADAAVRLPVAPSHPDWRTALADAIADPVELCRLLDLPQRMAESSRRAAEGFPLLVPWDYLKRIRPGDQKDPLLLQVLPVEQELAASPRFTRDPLGEASAADPSCLLAKYQGRILMVATGACAVHCRFCFRRHFPYRQAPPISSRWRLALEQIAEDVSVQEVVLSGGDPLTLGDDRLADLSERLADIPHLRRLRIHTRLPVLIPQRVNQGLIAWLRGTRLAPSVVVHVNHPAEIDGPVAAALARLIDAGIPVLSQSVLLRGINDDADVLTQLCERLIDLRVMPYYLHQLDPVAGAAHFEVAPEIGRGLVEELRKRLPGYAVPRYVRETPGEPNKTPLA